MDMNEQDVRDDFNSLIDSLVSCESCQSMFVSPVGSTGDGYASLLMYGCLRTDFPGLGVLDWIISLRLVLLTDSH